MDSGLLQTQGVGTPGYLAPEQIEPPASGYGAAVDIFALGAVVFCMLTGSPPFTSYIDTYKYGNAQLRFPSEALDGFSPSCLGFVQTAMAAQASQRPSIDELLGLSWLPTPPSSTSNE